MEFNICVGRFNEGFDKVTRSTIDYSTNEDLFTAVGRSKILSEVSSIIDQYSAQKNERFFLLGLMSKEEKENILPQSVLPKDSIMYGLVSNLKNQYPYTYGDEKYANIKALEQILCTAGGGYDTYEDKDKKIILPRFFKPSKKLNSIDEAVEFVLSNKFKNEKSEKYAEDFAKFVEHKSGDFGMYGYLVDPPKVGLYPLFSSKLMDVAQGGYEDSAALGAYDLLNYFLHRPVWELSGYSYNMLLSSIPSDKTPETAKKLQDYKDSVLDGSYREWYIDQGLGQRQHLEKAYYDLKENYKDLFEKHKIGFFEMPEKDISAPRCGMDSYYLKEEVIQKVNKEESKSKPSI
ncbi:MAG: hypothetical protein QG564_1583 [Campylobacterota bacterium]|nr:hypothetical protein [Campylobacterota bacterium]